MTIELDSTLAQAEVLFLSYAQLVADIDRRTAEGQSQSSSSLHRRSRSATVPSGDMAKPKVVLPTLSENLRELLKAGR